MIVALSFTNLDEDTYTFITNAAHRVKEFSPAAELRSVQRPRMQAPGRWPTPTIAEALPIHHEGLIIGSGVDFAAKQVAALTERESMLAIILASAVDVPLGEKLGVLTVQLAHWDESASADVALDSYDAPLAVENAHTCPYMFAWSAFTPYFVGDDTDEHYQL